MKKLLSLLLSIGLISLSVIPTFAQTNNIIISDLTIEEIEASEAKIYCNATIEDEFDDSSVIVLMNNKTSLELKDFEKSDFSEIDAVATEDLTTYQIEDLKEERQMMQDKNNSASTLSMTAMDNEDDGEFVDDSDDRFNSTDNSEFHQMIKIDLKTNSKQAVLNAIRELEKRDDVYAAQPNYIYHFDSVTPNDTYSNKQWAINKINLPAAWSITTGSKAVTVGVIDSGIKRNHPDLTTNVDTTLSKSFADDSDPFNDTDGHGTHVAGIIGAVGNNNKGITGTCWNIKLISLKVPTSSENQKSEEIQTSGCTFAINYASKMKVDILNCSLSKDEYDIAFQEAIKNYGGLFVCSAGNKRMNYDNGYLRYPTSYKLPNMISVAATDENDKLTDFSNYGKSSVHIAAPGNEIYSTYNNGSYTNLSGTSMAAPYVAGVAALIKSKYPNITPDGMKLAITKGCDKLSSLSGKVGSGGRLNAYKALNEVKNFSKYTVKYNANGGSGATMSDTVVTYGLATALTKNTYSVPQNLQNHKFIGWYAHRKSDNKWFYESGWYVEGTQPNGEKKHLYQDGVKIAHSSKINNDVITMYAQWDYISYNIKYNANGGGGPYGMASHTAKFNVWTKLSKNVFDYTAYTFSGWNVYRHSDGKSYYENDTGKYGGWYVVGNEPAGYYRYIFPDETSVYGLSSVDNDTIEMFACWEPNQFKLSFDQGEGGTGSMPQINGKTNVPLQLSANTFKKSNYSFLGWYLCDEYGYWSSKNAGWTDDSNCVKKLYRDKDSFTYEADCVDDEVTAYAQWIKTSDIILGDVNMDGRISVLDANEIQKYLSSQVNFSEAHFIAADVDHNGRISINDATTIQKYLTGAITEF